MKQTFKIEIIIYFLTLAYLIKNKNYKINANKFLNQKYVINN